MSNKALREGQGYFFGWIMRKIRKPLRIKILAIFIIIYLFIDTIAYAAPTLRVNLIFDEIGREHARNRISISLEQSSAIDSLVKELSSIREHGNITQLIPKLLLIADIHRSIARCFKNDRPYQAGKITIEAIKNNIPGIETEDVKSWIDECFKRIWPYQAGEIAIEAIKISRPSRDTEKIVNLLRDPAIFIKGELDLILGITCYALETDGLDDLHMILPSLWRNKHIFDMLRTFTIQEGYGFIMKEIFEHKGVEHFAALYNNIYGNIFHDLLPDDLSITDRRTNFLLRHLVRFDISNFARSDLTLEEIYNSYKEAHDRGDINGLPPGIPEPRVIEISTKKSGSITPDTQTYYNGMIGSIRKALSMIDTNQVTENPLYKDLLEELISLMDQRISTLRENMQKKGLPGQAKGFMQEDLDTLDEARGIVDSLKENGSFPLENLNIAHLNAISKIKNISTVISDILFIHALQDNTSWQAYFRGHISDQVSLVSISKIIEFIDSFIKPHLLDDLGENERRSLITHINIKIFKEELNRFGQERSQFTRRIRLIPTRGWVAEFIGYFSDECWTQTLDIMRDNPDAIALVMVDDDTNELLGGTLLMPNSIKGEKVIIDRGLSPRTELTADLHVDDFVSRVTDFEEEIARSLGATKILVPLRDLEPGLGSNNPDIIQHYGRTVSGNTPVTFDTRNNFNDHDITTGKCVVLRSFSLLVDSAVPTSHNTRVDI